MLIESIFLISLMMLLWLYIGYPLFLFVVSKIGKDQIRASEIKPRVSVVVCTYNEAAVIDRRIRNLLDQKYPENKLDIIIVDSGSTDGTTDIVKKNWSGNVILLEQGGRLGKASAINLALRKASGEVIVLSDAPTLYYEDTTENIVKNFADPRVGGATGRYDPLGGDKGLEGSEKLLWKFKDLIRNLEGRVDSTSFLSGELCAFRRGLVDKVDEDSLADDVNIAMKIREKGYRVICDPCAAFMEKLPTSHEDLLSKKVRGAIGGIRETLRFKKMILNPDFGLFGMLILPTRLLYTLLNPFIFLSFLVSFAYIFVLSAFHFLLDLHVIVSLLFVCMLVVIFKESLPIKVLKTCFTTGFIQLQALIKYMCNDFDVKWKQVESTRK